MLQLGLNRFIPAPRDAKAAAVFYAMASGGVFERIFGLMHKIGAVGIIGGGAAVDYELATDIDVFFVGDMNGLRKYGAYQEHSYDEIHGSPFVADGVIECEWSPKKIHFVNVKSLAGVVGKFDLSIHAWGLDAEYNVLSCERSTKPGEPIRILNPGKTTADRLVKLTKRYHPA